MKIKMNTLTIKWMVFIITTTMIYETVQGLTLRGINNILLNNYTTDYMEKNISSYEYDNGTTFNKTESACKDVDNFKLHNTVMGIIAVGLLIGCVSVGCKCKYTVIIRKWRRRLSRAIFGKYIINRTNNIQIHSQFMGRMNEVRMQRNLSQHNRRRARYRRSSQTEQFQMINIPVEKIGERVIFVNENNTKNRQRKRSCQQSQPTSFVTHAIIERESTSEDYFESHEK